MDSDFFDERAKLPCALRGQNPYEMVSHSPAPNPDGSVYAVCLRSPRWKLTRDELHDFSLMQQALK